MKLLLSILCFLGLLALPCHAQDGQGLAITELMSSNTVILDEDGDSSDWIEIYNGSGGGINLNGYGLSDDSGDPAQWTFPDYNMAAGEYLLVFISGKDRPSPNPYFHVNFGLSADGDAVYLTNASRQIIDSVTFGKIPRNLSYGKHSNEAWEYYTDRTPGRANGVPLTAVPQFSVPGGFYSSSVTVSFSNISPDTQIYYTTDGRTATTGSPRYTSSISISRTTTIRAVAVRSGYMTSPPAGQTYFINFDRKGLPVVAIASEEENLWDEDTGIFVGDGDPDDPNMRRREQRPIHVDYFNENGEIGFSQSAWIQVVGDSSRQEWMRPFKISSDESERDAMHSHFEYPVLKKSIQKFRHIRFRNDNQDGVKTFFYDPLFKPTLIRNDLFSNLIREDQKIDFRDSRSTVLMVINGFNYGVMDIGEHRDNSTVEANHPQVDGDNVDTVTIRNDAFEPIYGREDNGMTIWDYYGLGTAEYEEISADARLNGGKKGIQDFFDLTNFMQSHNLGDHSNYAYVKERLDIESYLSSISAQCIAGNLDYPNNNFTVWRNAPVGAAPGPWITSSYDYDATFGLTDSALRINTLPIIYDNSKHLAPLLNNTEFKNAFIRKFDELLNGAFSSANAIAFVNQAKARLDPWISYHLDLWSLGLITYEDWKQNVNHLIRFLELRPADMRGYVEQFFHLPGSSQLSFSVSPGSGGTIYLENLSSQTNVSGVTGTYFNGVPMTLVAKNQRGYRFDHFQVGGTYVPESLYTFTPSGNITVEVVFEKDDSAPAAEVSVNEIVNGGEEKILDEDYEEQDWIEIYNTTDRPLDLTGKYLTDDETDLTKWEFPAMTLAPGEFKVVFASGKDRRNPLRNLHTSFKISSGEPVLLVDKNGVDIFDQMTKEEVSNIEPDHSGGRIPDGSTTFKSLETATPGFSNFYEEPPAPAEIISPVPNSTLESAEVMFQWNAGSQVEQYQLNIGRKFSIFSKRESSDFIFSYRGSDTSVLAQNLPQDGNDFYARIWSLINGQWIADDVVTYHTERQAGAGLGDEEGEEGAEDPGNQTGGSDPGQEPDQGDQQNVNSPPKMDIRIKEIRHAIHKLNKRNAEIIEINPPGNDFEVKWNKGVGADRYCLDAGSTKAILQAQGQGDIYSKEFDVDITSDRIENHLRKESPVYLRLWTRFHETWIPGPIVDVSAPL